MNSKVYRKTPAIILVLLLVVSFLGSEGTLLCFGKEGHVKVEFVDACNGRGLGSQLAGMENDACGLCKDVQFLSSPVCTNSASNYSQTLPLMSPSLPPKEYPSEYIKLPQYSHPKTLASLHSVVLLI